MKYLRFVLLGTVVSLAACASNDVATFYHQNPYAAATAPKKSEPAFILADESPATTAMLKGYRAKGYRVLGISDFSNLAGAPMRAQALAYGKQIGADLIVYIMMPVGPEVHTVNRLVMDSPGGFITTDTNLSGSMNYYGDVNGYGTYSGTGTSSTYVPPQFHGVLVPETFYRNEHGVIFLAR